MITEVIIPWRAGCPHRERALGWVLDRYHRHGYRTTVAEAPDGPWCKAAAVTPAVEASSADIIVMADADVWCDGLAEAIAADAPWAIPHRLVHRLTPTVTEAVLAGVELEELGRHDCEQPPYRGFAGGGIVILPRSTYLDVPLDPRFEGWSGEDESWARALSTLVGDPWRGDADLYHLWHPPQPRMNRRHGSPASEALTFNYRQAKGRPVRMRALIEAGRQWRTSSNSTGRRSVNF